MGNEIFWILCCILCFAENSEAQCEFPPLIQNANWTSSNFGTMSFLVSNVTFDANDWTCLLNNGSQYVVRSLQTITQFGAVGYEYYCLHLTKQNDFSYSLYIQTSIDHTGKRIKTFVVSDVPSTVERVCDTTVDVAEFHVLVKAGKGFFSIIRFDHGQPWVNVCCDTQELNILFKQFLSATANAYPRLDMVKRYCYISDEHIM